MHKKIILVLIGTLLLDMTGIGMVFPILPIIFTDPSSHFFLLQGYSKAGQFFLAGLVASLTGLMQFIAAPILGELSDAYGRKKLLILGVGVLAISQVLFGFGIAIASVPLILFSRAVAGLAGANFAIAQAAIADITAPQDRAKNFGLMGAAFGIGFILGPVLGGWIAGETGNPASPFFLAGLLGIINVIFVSLLLHETNLNRTPSTFTIFKGFSNVRQAFLDKDARGLYIASFLYLCGFAFFTSFVGVLLVNNFGFDEKSIGIFFGIVGIWIVLAQAVVLRFVMRIWRERQVLRFSLPTLALTVACYPFLPRAEFLYLVMPLMALSQGLSMANMPALISKSVGETKQGAALGINASLLALSQGLVPFAAGAFSGTFGIVAPFVFGGVFIIAAWYVLMNTRPQS